LVWPVTAATRIAEIAGHDRRKCLATLSGGDATNLPSANNRLRNSA